MDKSHPFYNIKPNQPLGDRLILRYPERSRAFRDALIPDGGALPKSLTLGYFRQLDHPPHAWCFMPVNQPLAIAALEIESVQARICEDLAIRLRETQQHDDEQ
jgi:hypothetical protein